MVSRINNFKPGTAVCGNAFGAHGGLKAVPLARINLHPLGEVLVVDIALALKANQGRTAGRPEYASVVFHGCAADPSCAPVKSEAQELPFKIPVHNQVPFSRKVKEVIDPRSRIISDDYSAYRGTSARFYGGHQVVKHRSGEYVRGDVYTNTAESSFAIIKRGIVGTYHNVSKEYLDRYIAQFDFLWNHRKLNDGERTVLAIKQAEGKRLMYKAS